MVLNFSSSCVLYIKWTLESISIKVVYGREPQKSQWHIIGIYQLTNLKTGWQFANAGWVCRTSLLILTLSELGVDRSRLNPAPSVSHPSPGNNGLAEHVLFVITVEA